MEGFDFIFSILFFITVIFIAVTGIFVIKGIKILHKSSKMILFNRKESRDIDNCNDDHANHTNEEKKTKDSNISIVATTGIAVVYYLSQYLFSYSILPNTNIILAILLTLLFCYHSIFCKSQYRRLFLIVLGFASEKLAMYYCDYMILSYDFYTHANINLIAHYVIKIFTIINLLLFIIKGVRLFLNTEYEYESAWYQCIDNAIKNYKSTKPKYTTPEEMEEIIKESGEKGEANVRYHLRWLYGYKVLNNVILPNPLEPQEFDHIVFLSPRNVSKLTVLPVQRLMDIMSI